MSDNIKALEEIGAHLRAATSRVLELEETLIGEDSDNMSNRDSALFEKMCAVEEQLTELALDIIGAVETEKELDEDEEAFYKLLIQRDKENRRVK
jgi:hypothetical protein